MNQFTRREFLKTSGALVVGFSVAGGVTAALSQGTPGKPALMPDELDSWLAVHKDGSVTAYFGKTEMGQGVDVAIAQIVADELDVAYERVSVVMGDTALTCNQGGASGSTGIQMGGRALRNAAAEARRVLVELGAKKLGVSPAECAVDNGVVHVPGYALQRVSYAELVGGRYFQHKLTWNKQYGNPLNVNGAAKPKDPSQYKVVGKSFPQPVIRDKVFGRQQYVTDVKVDGMLHARVIRPANAGCTIVSVDEQSIAAIPGARVVREKDFLAVVADKEWDAVRAARSLKVKWSDACTPFPGHQALHAHIRKANVVLREEPVKNGDVDAAFKTATRVVQAEYEWPLQSHASMGPACAVADMTSEHARLWTGSQKPHYGRVGCARINKMSPERIRAQWIWGPGSYGRNDAGDAAVDAGLLSRLTGRTVRVQYMRHDGTGWDPKGPAAVYRGRAAIDGSGNVVAYEFVAKGFSRQDVVQVEADPKDTLAGQFTGWKAKGNDVLAVPAERYAFPNKRLAWEMIPPMLNGGSPLRTGHFRDPLGAETHFASESFIDEVAHAIGADPVAFRLKHISDARHAACVKAVAEKAKWDGRPNPNRGKGDVMTGRGFSYTERNGTVVAIVAEVEVDRRTGRVWAKKFWCAHDCGLIINPGSMQNVIEGNIVQALSRTLFEEVQFNRDSVTSVDWNTYPILEMQDAPESVEVVLINRPEIAPSGAGEPSTRTVPAAVANAIFDATGVRIRKVPLTPERVKAALEAARV